MSTLAIALSCACIAVVLVHVVGSEDSPLNAWLLWADEWHERGGWRAWIASPLGGCSRCTAGQLALWSSVAIRGGGTAQDILAHITAASAAVLFATAIAYGHAWISRRI